MTAAGTRFSHSLFVDVIFVVFIKSANQPDIYRRPSGSDDNQDQKRAADKTKNAKKKEKSTFSSLLFPIAIAIPDSIVTGVDTGSANIPLSTDSRIS